jgi:hypothetical protein
MAAIEQFWGNGCLMAFAARRSHIGPHRTAVPTSAACVGSYQRVWGGTRAFDHHTEGGTGHLSHGRRATKYKHRKGDGFCMLAKCANPSCCASFRNRQAGRLFRLEADRELTPSANSCTSSQSRVEYFWLCSRCSEFMALRFGQDGTVVTVSLPDSARRNPEDFAIISRHKHKRLRSVTLVRRRGEGHSELRSVRNLRS